MIGGRFKVASVASIAAAGLFMGGVAAQAADLGGNCCADLEERVAELEATTARKGNRNVSLEVSGQVNEHILLWDDGVDEEAYIVTGIASSTRFRFKGSAKINADWSAGFLIEIGLNRTGKSNSADQDSRGNQTGLNVRHQAMYIRSNSLGSIWLGHTSVAVDGIADICLGCTTTNSHFMNLSVGGFDTRYNGTAARGPSYATLGFGDNVASDGSRRQVLKYVSPTVAGFVLAADWSGSEAANLDDRWSAALRYAGEFGAIRVAAGIGAHGGEAVSTTSPTEDLFGWGASLTVQHSPTGLFVAGSFGEQKDSRIVAAGARDTADGWSVTAGMGQKWNSLGTTTIWARYAEFSGRATAAGATTTVAGVAATDLVQGDTTTMAVGVNQMIDAAALELYATYFLIEGDYVNATTGTTFDPKDFQAVLIGGKIKF